MIQVKKTFLVGIFFITLLSGFFTYSTLHAQTPDFSNPEVRKSYGLSPEEVIKASGDGNSIIGGWLQNGIEFVLQIITQITAFFLWVATVFFNNFIYYTVAESAIRDNPFIAVGWQFFRDLANMLFIFIIMYIGISTMLDLGGGNTRSLLVRVIAVAILINFSLAMTRVVIDASNIAALGFYDAFPAGTKENTPLGKYYSYPHGSKNIAAPFMNYSGIAILKGNEQFKAWSVNEETDFTQLVIAYVATAIMHVIAIFVFGAGGILFLIRMITLWVLMILAPIAFISYATPHMESHFKKWWSLLLKQSFFAVAFLALIYISARMLTSASFFKSLEIATNNSFLGGILGVIIQFAFVAGLLIMALTVSQSLGAYGASTIVNWGNARQRRIRGRLWDGSTSFAGTRTRSVLAPTVTRFENSQGGAAQALRSIPGVNAVTRRFTRARQQDIEKHRTELSGMSDQQVRNAANQLLASPERRAAAIEVLGERRRLAPPAGETGRLTNEAALPDTVGRALGHIDAAGRQNQARTVRGVAWQYATTPPEMADAIYNPGANTRLAPAEAEHLRVDYFAAGPENAPVRERMYQIFGQGHLQNIINRNDNVADQLFNNLRQDVNAHLGRGGAAVASRDDLITYLENPAINNRRLVGWVRSNAGRDLLTGYGFT
jgi:hypothetical protein